MNKKRRHLALVVLASLALAFAVWALLHFTARKRQRLNQASEYLSSLARPRTEAELWIEGAEKVKADRGESAGRQAAVPSQLRHYSDTRWFLATQIAEVRKYNIQSSQDFLDLAEMIERGEMVAVPVVTDNYILFGVGGNADTGVFSHYEDGHSVGVYNDAQLRDEYARLDTTRSNLQTEIATLKARLRALKKRDRKNRTELEKEISERQQELKSNEENKQLLDRFYGQPESRQKLFNDYQWLQTLAKNFRGQSYDLDELSDRQALKVSLLRSLRPEAFKVLQELAAAYHQKFDRPLPVSSLVRPEQYQHALSKVNANAILIDTPPHSTGLAFDIDYRYMGAEEQSFLMAELARMKDEGRIEVLRERNANYHVFAFINGIRPNDELIAAALDEAGPPRAAKESHHAVKKAGKTRSKGPRAGLRKAKRRR